MNRTDSSLPRKIQKTKHSLGKQHFTFCGTQRSHLQRVSLGAHNLPLLKCYKKNGSQVLDQLEKIAEEIFLSFWREGPFPFLLNFPLRYF